ARTMAPKAISRRVTMMTPQRSIWILRARLHAAIQLARTDDHVQVSNQPREGASDMAGKWCVDAPNSVAGDRFPRLRLLIQPQKRRKNMSNPTKRQDRGTRATPASGAKAGATQGTFMTSDAIPWKLAAGITAGARGTRNGVGRASLCKALDAMREQRRAN